MKPVAFDMAEFIKEIAVLFGDIAGQKTITIRCELPLVAHDYADKAMISTVLRIWCPMRHNLQIMVVKSVFR